MLKVYIIVLLFMTVITQLIYSYDFSVSVGNWDHRCRSRIPEFVLLALAALGGGIGAWIAMTVLRHKVSARKSYFKLVVYTSITLSVITLAAMTLVTIKEL